MAEANRIVDNFITSYESEVVDSNTALPVDDVLKFTALYVPLALLAVISVFCPELTVQAGVQCFHVETQGGTEMNYVNNYCWEHLQEARFEESNSTVTQAFESLQYHKLYPLALLFITLFGSIPSILWNICDFDASVKANTKFVERAVIEALQESLRQVVSFVKSDKREKISMYTGEEADPNNSRPSYTFAMKQSRGMMKSQAKCAQKLASNIYANSRLDESFYRLIKNHVDQSVISDKESPFATKSVKYDSFSRFIYNRLQRTKILAKYSLKRMTQMFLLFGVSYLMWHLYIEHHFWDSFECRVPMSPVVGTATDPTDFHVLSNGVDRLAMCQLKSVDTRILTSYALIFLNAAALAWASLLWMRELDNFREARLDWSVMLDLAMGGNESILPYDKLLSNRHEDTIFRHSDFDVMVELAGRNLSDYSRGNQIYKTCRFALNVAHVMTRLELRNMDNRVLYRKILLERYMRCLCDCVAKGMDSLDVFGSL